ncbi:MAG: hypothetical protein IJ366_00335 [Clostridia bacterium]|nr:hypothetical protein [Clostridia bacterium]
MTPADIAAVCGNSRNSNDGMFGNDWAWIIILLLFGYNGRGFGGFGGGFGGQGASCGCSPCATQADVRAAVDQQTLISKLDQQTYGLADSTYALNNTITAGFHGVDNAICNLGYNVQSGFNSLGHQISDCCCQTQRAIDRVAYENQANTCALQNTINGTTRDIIDNANANSRAILDFLTQDKIATLTAENQALKFQASQTAQNAYIGATVDSAVAELIRRTGNDCPQPSYIVQPPQPVTFPTNCCGTVNYASNGCGCGGF